MPAAQLWGFGPFEFDERTGELRRGGLRIKLQEQPARVLALLLQKKDDLVTREQLRSHRGRTTHLSTLNTASTRPSELFVVEGLK
jgi:DNA-binding winged helix-turn-helix (wHTH) protein